MQVIPIEIPELGNRSYLVHDGKIAIVIDPSRRVQQIVDLAQKEQVEIQGIFETHIHNDYLTGGYSLSQKLRVPYFVSSKDTPAFPHKPIDDEQMLKIGDLQITALPSPGHTHNHLGFLVTAADTVPAFFSGGSLLYGSVGRTDLITEQDTLDLAKDQYRTAQFLRTRLAGETELFPTHGFGSFCAAIETESISVSTLEQQARTNPVFNAKNESTFVQDLIAGLDDYPAYYAYMGPMNAAGPREPVMLSPTRLTRAAIMSTLHTGVAIVDMRNRTDFSLKHLKGTYNIELSTDFATYVGWLIAWEAPIIVIATSPEEVSIAQEQLSLIGREVTGGQISANALLSDKDATTSYPVQTFQDLKAALQNKDFIILDVRRRSEWKKAHMADAIHIPLHELSSRMNELDTAKKVWVYCMSGFRAAIAASMLESAGKQPTLINDSFTNAAKASLLAIREQHYVQEIVSGRAQLVDVRDASEWNLGHALPAMHVPLGMMLDGDLGSLDKTKPIYLYCDTGDRSGMAESYLRELGIKAINIGGLSDWIQAGGNHG